MAKIKVQDQEITIVSHNEEDYISLTDMANAKQNANRAADVIKNNIIPQELTSQQISVIYATEADVLNIALFGMTAKDWREQNPTLKGNIRDYATINQLICLSNMENINSVFINNGMSQSDRLKELNKIAIHQMKILENNVNKILMND